MSGPRTYTLLGTDGKPYQSASKGPWGGHRGTRIYGRLDCPAALRAVGRGGYTRYRVFFADEATAIAADYRPCASCCPDRYQEWKNTRQQQQPPARSAARPGPGPASAGVPTPAIEGQGRAWRTSSRRADAPAGHQREMLQKGEPLMTPSASLSGDLVSWASDPRCRLVDWAAVRADLDSDGIALTPRHGVTVPSGLS
jgi:hypothetical protein